MEPTLNELSIGNYPSVREARLGVSLLIRTLVSVARIRGTQPVLRAIAGYDSRHLCDDYPLKKWRNDLEVPHDERSYLRSISAWVPAIDPARDAPALINADANSVFTFRGQTCIGLGVAAITDAVSVSFSSHADWDSHLIPIDELIHANGEIEEIQVSVRNASTPEHALAHKKELEAAYLESISDGIDLWDRRISLFPHLSLSHSTGATIATLDRGDEVFHQVVDRLRRLDDAALKWRAGAFLHRGIGVKSTPESKATLRDNPNSRTFHCTVRGAPHLYSWHLRTTGRTWRIYYEPIEPGRISVGYIGPKMSTISAKV
jgi:hypothetical protein